jgi:hypothetical protein
MSKSLKSDYLLVAPPDVFVFKVLYLHLMVGKLKIIFKNIEKSWSIGRESLWLEYLIILGRNEG